LVRRLAEDLKNAGFNGQPEKKPNFEIRIHPHRGGGRHKFC